MMYRSLTTTTISALCLILWFTLTFSNLSAQSNPVALRPDISILPVKSAPTFCTGIAIDPVTQQLHVTRANGDILRVRYPGPMPVTDTLLFTAPDHGVMLLKGLMFSDSTLFIIGNNNIDTSQTIGIIRRGDLISGGGRVWTTVVETVPYQLGNGFFDHGISGLCLSPGGDSIYFNSGSRTDHGEEQENAGLYPDLREVPLTSAIFRIPFNATGLVLQNDSASLAPYLFADGTRNTFKMAFNAKGHLIGCENSGDRDDPDELNYLKQDHHYGFPWIMGGNLTPQQFQGYIPANDPLLNPLSNSYLQGHFYDDPGYPQLPGWLTTTNSVENYGPDTDKYRDPSNGNVLDASDQGFSLGTFTPHKSVLGLVFDNDSLLHISLKGQGFVMGNQRGGDSLGNAPGGGFGAILDPGEDMLALDMQYDPQTDTYTTQCKRIIEGFNRPVDACMSGTKVYVLEYGRPTAPATIYEISLPPDISTVSELQPPDRNLTIAPNPVAESALVEFECEARQWALVELYDMKGSQVATLFNGIAGPGTHSFTFHVNSIPTGTYYLKVDGTRSKAVSVVR